jgi:hypothetical protein
MSPLLPRIIYGPCEIELNWDKFGSVNSLTEHERSVQPEDPIHGHPSHSGIFPSEADRHTEFLNIAQQAVVLIGVVELQVEPRGHVVAQTATKCQTAFFVSEEQ